MPTSAREDYVWTQIVNPYVEETNICSAQTNVNGSGTLIDLYSKPFIVLNFCFKQL
jgi:hypothetical protein